ncbi:MAG: DEAD/DEAH box helicase [Lentimicrobium sp.]|nr:DEAD/DEAH box helicase [Lentimicrobium sp.]
MKFADSAFNPMIKTNLAAAGFSRPTDIQFKAIPPVLRGEDVLAIAQTGTGKTAAFVIPVLEKLLKNKRKAEGIRCMVMVPTRELSRQITSVFNTLGKGTGIKTLGLHGGVEQDPQISRLEKGVDVAVATPGRLFDLISQGYVDVSQLEILILDEADHMLDLGFIHDIRQLVKKLPGNRQTLFFSATINPEIKKLAYSLVRNPIRIQISPKDPVSKNVDHSVAFIEMDDKRFFLERLIKEHPESKILVFVRTKVRAERVNKALERVGIESRVMHGDVEQKERFSTLQQFSDGKFMILIATDVSARGIDIPNVEYVINYDLPEKAENYVHRIGRTGRGNHRGLAISFCSQEEKPLLVAIEEFMDKKIQQLQISKTEYETIIETATEGPSDWKQLIMNAEKEEEKYLKKKKKK